MLKFGKCGLSLLISVGKRRKDPVTSCGSFDRKINSSRVLLPNGKINSFGVLLPSCKQVHDATLKTSPLMGTLAEIVGAGAPRSAQKISFEEFLTSSEKLRPLGFYFLILSSMICFCNPTPGARNLMKSAWRSRNIPWYPQNLFNKFPWSRMILFSVIFRIFWSPRSPLTLFNSPLDSCPGPSAIYCSHCDVSMHCGASGSLFATKNSNEGDQPLGGKKEQEWMKPWCVFLYLALGLKNHECMVGYQGF